MGRPGPRDPAVTSRIMKRIRGKDGKAERKLRAELFARGVRYRKHDARLIGTPDLVMPGPRVVVFVDGDFWHGNGWKLRGLPDLASQFPTKTEYWVAKITRNMERDRRYTADLTALGWTVLRFWESDILKDVAAVADRVVLALRSKQAG